MITSINDSKVRELLFSVIINLMVVLLYFLLAKFAFYLSVYGNTTTPIWPSSGVAFVFYILYNKKVIPGIFIGVLLSNFSNFTGYLNEYSLSFWTFNSIVALGNVLEVVIPYALLKWFGEKDDILRNQKGVFVLLLGAILGVGFSAFVGNFALLFFGLIADVKIDQAFFTWVSGGVISIFTMGPLVSAIRLNKKAIGQVLLGQKFYIYLIIASVCSYFVLGFDYLNISAKATIVLIFSVLLNLFFHLPKGLMLVNVFITYVLVSLSVLLNVGTEEVQVSELGKRMVQLNFVFILVYLLIYLLIVAFKDQYYNWTLKFRKRLAVSFPVKVLLSFKVQAIQVAFIIGLLGLLITLLLWSKLEESMEEELGKRTELVADELVEELQGNLGKIAKSFERQAYLLEDETYINHWAKDAEKIIETSIGIKLIELIDSSMIITHTVPYQSSVLGYDLHKYPELWRVLGLENARFSQKVNYTRNIQLIQGGEGFLIDVPRFKGGEVIGWVTGVIDLQELFTEGIGGNKGYVYTIYERGKVIFQHADTMLIAHDYGLKKNIDLGGKKHWQLVLYPTKETVFKVNSFLSIIVLGFGFFGSIVLSLVVYLGRFSNINAYLSKKASSALKRAKNKAEAAVHSKSDFLSMMSHEMRTPLNAVVGLGHILLSEDPRKDQKEHLDLLQYSAQNLLLLINDILDFSKIEAGKLELEHEQFDLFEVVKSIRDSVQFKSDEYEVPVFIEFDGVIDHYVYGDKLRVSQVLNNLVSNAVKFTNDGFVKITLNISEKLDNYVVKFQVIDTGIGISTEKQKIIFEEFSQAESSTTRRFGGTGLGLAITSRLLEIMNGKIEVDSTINEGSVFSFQLTFEKGESLYENGIKGTEKTETTQFNGKKILLVEDNSINAFVAKRFLEKASIEYDWVTNGLAAVKRVTHFDYDLILMDLQMPEMDGFQASKKIREKNIQTPIIALTAKVIGEVEEDITVFGMNDFLGKPFEPIDFELLLKKWLI